MEILKIEFEPVDLKVYDEACAHFRMVPGLSRLSPLSAISDLVIGSDY